MDRVHAFLRELDRYREAGHPEFFGDGLPLTRRAAVEMAFRLASRRMELTGGRDRDLLDGLAGLDEAEQLKGCLVNTDVQHTGLVISAGNTVFTSLDVEQRTALELAAVCHDCAYDPTPDHQSTGAREEHMARGAEATLCIGGAIDLAHRDVFCTKTILTASEIVKTHDTPSLGEPFDTCDPMLDCRLAFRSADRLAMIDCEIDVLRKLARHGYATLADAAASLEFVLAHNIVRFIEECRLYDGKVAFRSYCGHQVLFRTDEAYTAFQNLLQRKLLVYGIPETRFLTEIRRQVADSEKLQETAPPRPHGYHH